MLFNILTIDEINECLSDGNVTSAHRVKLIKKGIKNYYEISGNMIGGILHVVLEDGNFEDWVLLSCLNDAIKKSDFNAILLISLIAEVPEELRKELFYA